MMERSSHEKTLLRLIVVGASLSLGILGAIISSMQDFVGGNAVFELSYRTFVGFGLGALAGWFFWRIVRFLNERAKGSDHSEN
jgi:hypothetical protein